MWYLITDDDVPGSKSVTEPPLSMYQWLIRPHGLRQSGVSDPLTRKGQSSCRSHFFDFDTDEAFRMGTVGIEAMYRYVLNTIPRSAHVVTPNQCATVPSSAHVSKPALSYWK